MNRITNNNNIEKAKCAQLDMLIELDRICQKNDIPYFLVGGTLIGAIRHNGFIPWDDDIDVGMLREDYFCFIDACKKDLSNDYSLYDWYIDPLSPLPFLKMKIKGTHYREALSKNTMMNDEIFIDIFPFDNAPDSSIMRIIHAKHNIIYKKIILLKCGFSIDKGIARKIMYLPLRLIAKTKSITTWKAKYAYNAMKYNNTKTTYVVNLGGSYSYKKETKKQSYFKKLIRHDFEGKEFLVPEQYDTVLKEIYGNYLDMPSEEDRVSRHGIDFIDLGTYSIKNKISQ